MSQAANFPKNDVAINQQLLNPNDEENKKIILIALCSNFSRWLAEMQTAAAYSISIQIAKAIIEAMSQSTEHPAEGTPQSTETPAEDTPQSTETPAEDTQQQTMIAGDYIKQNLRIDDSYNPKNEDRIAFYELVNCNPPNDKAIAEVIYKHHTSTDSLITFTFQHLALLNQLNKNKQKVDVANTAHILSANFVANRRRSFFTRWIALQWNSGIIAKLFRWQHHSYNPIILSKDQEDQKDQKDPKYPEVLLGVAPLKGSGLDDIKNCYYISCLSLVERLNSKGESDIKESDSSCPSCDHTPADVSTYARAIMEAVIAFLLGKTLYIHCWAGVERSAFFVAVFLYTLTNCVSKVLNEDNDGLSEWQKNLKIILKKEEGTPESQLKYECVRSKFSQQLNNIDIDQAKERIANIRASIEQNSLEKKDIGDYYRFVQSRRSEVKQWEGKGGIKQCFKDRADCIIEKIAGPSEHSDELQASIPPNPMNETKTPDNPKSPTPQPYSIQRLPHDPFVYNNGRPISCC